MPDRSARAASSFAEVEANERFDEARRLVSGSRVSPGGPPRVVPEVPTRGTGGGEQPSASAWDANRAIVVPVALGLLLLAAAIAGVYVAAKQWNASETPARRQSHGPESVSIPPEAPPTSGASSGSRP
jgi:hypothetical protein